MKHLGLTPRQFEVAHLLSKGLTYEQVAERLGISARTVEHHAAEVRRRTNSSNNVAAISRVRARALTARSAD